VQRLKKNLKYYKMFNGSVGVVLITTKGAVMANGRCKFKKKTAEIMNGSFQCPARMLTVEVKKGRCECKSCSVKR